MQMKMRSRDELLNSLARQLEGIRKTRLELHTARSMLDEVREILADLHHVIGLAQVKAPEGIAHLGCHGQGCPLKLDCRRHTRRDESTAWFFGAPYNWKLKTCLYFQVEDD